jgi:hypothetical protein
MQLVVEVEVFSRMAERLFSRDERDEIAAEIAKNPEAWPIEPGTGGLRKARFGRGSKGKRGGARVIYLYLDRDTPIYLLVAYGKNEQDIMTSEQKKVVRQVVIAIKAERKLVRG